MSIDRLNSFGISNTPRIKETIRNFFKGISRENIFEGKIEQILPNDKAIISTDKSRFTAQINTKVYEGETILFEAKFTRHNIILKIIDRTFAESNNNLLQLSKIFDKSLEASLNLSNESPVNSIFKSIFSINLDSASGTKLDGEKISQQFFKFLINNIKNPDEILSALIEKISSLYSQKDKRINSSSEKEIKKLLSLFLSSTAKNHLSSLNENPVYSFYIPLFWQNNRTDIYLNFFGKNNKRTIEKGKIINAFIKLKLSEERAVSFLVYLSGSNLTYNVYSNDKDFINFLRKNHLTLKKNLKKIGLKIENASFNILQEDNELLKNDFFKSPSRQKIKLVA